MAVVFDAAGPGATASIVSSISWTHTPSGTPTAVGVWFGGYISAGTSSVTYGGTSMVANTFYGAVTNPAAQSFGLANPPSGAQTVVLTVPAGSYPASNSISVTGSDTSTCFRNDSGGTGSTNNSSSSVTSAVGDLVVDCVNGAFLGTVPSGVGANQTIRYAVTWNGNESFGISTQSGAAGTVTATWTNTGGSVGFAAAIDSFKAAAAAALAKGGTLPMMGVG
jgi:hypothetical protein